MYTWEKNHKACCAQNTGGDKEEDRVLHLTPVTFLRSNPSVSFTFCWQD